MADLELAAGAAVIAAGAEAEVSTAEAADKVGDDAVARSIEHAAVVEVCSSRDDKEGCSGRPWLLEEGGLGQSDDCIVWGEQAAQGIDALPDRGDSSTGT